MIELWLPVPGNGDPPERATVTLRDNDRIEEPTSDENIIHFNH